MKIKAYAKLNLALKVINKREDGYHNLVTIMDLINIYDEIYISKCDKVVFKCSDKSLENDNNLILKMITILKKSYPECENLGVNIYLKKHIPYGGGLGGGSSDAANVLIALNKMWDLNLSFEKLVDIAIKVGSDVPFFLLKSLGILSGMGENVNLIDSNLKLYYVIVLPGYPMYTKDVYENNKIYGDELGKIDAMIKGFNENNASLVINNMFNDLEASATSINNNNPKIIDIINDANSFIQNNNYLARAIMSGSGSTVFCAFANIKDAKSMYKYLIDKYNNVVLTSN